MNTYKFPIGDWSDDGHGQCDYFLVESPCDIQQIREAHFSCKEKFGFDIGDICHDYNDNEVQPHEIECITNMGIDLSKYCQDNNWTIYCTGSLVALWVEILNKIDPSLHLRYIPPIKYESINFYGYDKKKRHLKTPGYGLFNGE